MDPQLLYRKSHLHRSFLITKNSGPNYTKVWHFHQELELVAIVKSTGTRFIGDNVEKFQPNDVVLIGENLPHLWSNDDQYFKLPKKSKAESLVIHFNKNFAGEHFLSMPEMKMINELIHNARRGIKFNKDAGRQIIKQMESMLKMDDFTRVIELIKLLKRLAHEKNFEYISSEGFIQSTKASKKKKLDDVYEYIIKHFQDKISLDHIADMANMNKSAFCRYFKTVNGKTLSQYISEVRIGYACKLLLEQKFTIAEISDRCGFSNLSNFNRQFRRITKYSPTGYLNKYIS